VKASSRSLFGSGVLERRRGRESRLSEADADGDEKKKLHLHLELFSISALSSALNVKRKVTGASNRAGSSCVSQAQRAGRERGRVIRLEGEVEVDEEGIDVDLIIASAAAKCLPYWAT
jgi:hypothetical protein